MIHCKKRDTGVTMVTPPCLDGDATQIFGATCDVTRNASVGESGNDLDPTQLFPAHDDETQVYQFTFCSNLI